MTTTPAIVVSDLSKRYGDRTVLAGLSMTVEPGELVALLGPNGAGKTTTVEIVEGYRSGDGGTVRVLGADPATGGPGLRSRVGLMLQGGGFDPRTRPRETLIQYGRFHRDPRDPDELLALVGLGAVAKTPYKRLSGGEKQRLSLAVALVGRPEVAILDEPTAGMDPEARAVTRVIVADLRASGVAVLLTSHDLTDVERLADRICILDRRAARRERHARRTDRRRAAAVALPPGPGDRRGRGRRAGERSRGDPSRGEGRGCG